MELADQRTTSDAAKSVGAAIPGVTNNDMPIMRIGMDHRQLVKDLVLLAAVSFDVCNNDQG